MKSQRKITPLMAWLVSAAITLAMLVSLGQKLAEGIHDQTALELLSSISWVIMVIAFVTVGALIVSRRSNNVIGWLLMVPAAIFASASWFRISSPMSLSRRPTLAFLLALWVDNVNWTWNKRSSAACGSALSRKRWIYL